MYKLALCDDNERDLKEIGHMIDEIRHAHDMNVELVTYHDAGSLIEDVKSGNNPDVYMLDILMPETNGIEVARAIKEVDREPSIIYLTSSPDYALQAYGVHAMRYLLKPLKQEELYEAVNAAVETEDSKKKDKHFCLKTSEGLLCFSHKNILYAECFRRMVLLHTVDGKSVKSVCIRNSFEGELSELLAADNFLQTHKSYIVNMDYIDSFRQGEVRLISGDVIRISKNRQSQVKKCVLKYMADKNR